MTPPDVKFDRSETSATESLTVKTRPIPKRGGLLVPLLIAGAFHAALFGGIAWWYLKDHPATPAAPVAATDVDVAKPAVAPVATPAPQVSDAAPTVTSDMASDTAVSSASSAASSESTAASSITIKPVSKPPVAKKKAPVAKPARTGKTVKSAAKTSKTKPAKKAKTSTKPAKKAPPRPTRTLDLEALSKSAGTKAH